jgi:hypothetical protein
MSPDIVNIKFKNCMKIGYKVSIFQKFKKNENVLGGVLKYFFSHKLLGICKQYLGFLHKSYDGKFLCFLLCRQNA